jgi:NADPH-dependent curcumin reductase CurA
MQDNRQWRLRSRPVGLPRREDFEWTTAPAGEPGPGEVLVRNEMLSLDPAMRGWMREGRSYVPPVGIGEVMRALGAGKVVASNAPGIAVGDAVTGIVGVQDYAKLKANEVQKIDLRLAPMERWLGVLGMPGMTAFFGLFDIGKPEPGQCVVVSAAAGAVGAAAGQMARIHGCRVVGLAGGPDKCRFLVDELGFDAAIDYKREDVREALRTHCPKRIDVYFDNVGGEILDAALANLARHARVVICGSISQYNATDPIGPKNYMSLLVNRARMEGFVVFDFAARYAEAARTIAGWLADGRLKAREQVETGLQAFPEVLVKLYTGENFGKLVLEVAP